MIDGTTGRLARRPALERLASAGVGLGAVALLAVSAWLEPVAAGHSTHLQLGLMPCTFLAVTGWPCPMCGGTTTFALLADGRIVDGFLNQPFAALLFLGTIAIAVLGMLEAIAPRDRWRRISDVTIGFEGRIAALLGIAMIAGWTWKIWMTIAVAAAKT
jgi:hypothetical protein